MAGFIKRSIDVIASAFALILLAPVLALIAAAVRLTDGGPVLYRQTRVGLSGRRFTIDQVPDHAGRCRARSRRHLVRTE